MGLPEDSKLRELLTKRPSEDIRQLMRRIEGYNRLEDDRLQSKGKALLLNRSRQSVFPSRPRKDLKIHETGAQIEEVDEAFKEPMHKIVDRIKNEPYFRWPNKMRGDPSRRNQSLYCTYHRDKGHTTEQCRVLKDHLRKLVKAGYLKEFVVDSGHQVAEQGATGKGNPLPPPLGVIEVIHAVPKGSTMTKRGVLTLAPVGDCTIKQPPEKKVRTDRELIAFGDKDLKGAIQPHDNALVVTARISGFWVKRVMIDQGSEADMMYPDLFKGLELKNQDLIKYDTPLVSFDGKVVIPKGKIFLLVNMEGKEVTVTFIVVSSFSLYTTILGRSWIHAMGAIPSTLHVKVKFYTEQGVVVVRGSQKVARQDKQVERKPTLEAALL